VSHGGERRKQAGKTALLWWLGFFPHFAAKLEGFAAQRAEQGASPPQAWAALEESLLCSRWFAAVAMLELTAMPVPRRAPLFGTLLAQPTQKGVCSQLFCS